MKNLYSRISSRIQYTMQAFKTDCHFSPYFGYLRIADEFLGRLGLSAVSQKAHLKKDQWILSFLEDDLTEIVNKYTKHEYSGIFQENAPIWICWWTGENSAPPLVKQCIISIRKNAGNHPVVLITNKNYLDYISLPQYMLDAVEQGTMKLAHLADYIRVSLLNSYGGLWLDATIYCSQSIPETYFEYPFFTCKSETPSTRFISQMRWTTFILGGWKGNTVYAFLKEALEQYWSSHSEAIDYLLFDYTIELGREKIPFIRKEIQDVPENNIHRDDLQAAMNASLSAENFENIIQADTVLYKLSWRETYSLIDDSGKPSVFAHFLNLPSC